MATNRSLVLLATFLISVQATEMSQLLADNPSLFQPCETNLCFTFRSQQPNVVLDPQMRTADQQTLFKCRERASIFPHLSGLFFDVLDEMPELQNASCIWGGPEATFDGLVQFVRNVSLRNQSLKFVAGGILFQMAHRMSSGSIPSASMFNSKVVVVSVNRPALKAFNDAMNSIVGPFGKGTWWLLSGLILLFAALYAIINYCFLSECSLLHMHNAMLEPFVPRHWLLRKGIDDVVSGDESRESRAYLIRVWMRSALLFFVICALFWEIGVVNFITNDRPYVVQFKLYGMRRHTLKRFVVHNGGAMETMLRNLALPSEIAHNTRPWKTVATTDEIFDTLSETKSDMPLYTLSTNEITLYELNNRGLCSKLAVHDTSDLLPDYSTVWYYSSHINQSMRSILDIRISRLREKGRIRKLFESRIGKETLSCGLTTYSISIFVLLVPLGLVLCPFFVFILTVLLVRWILHLRDEKSTALGTVSTEENERQQVVEAPRRLAIF